jgi:tetratricopeptide (TPR) repeat protein
VQKYQEAIENLEDLLNQDIPVDILFELHSTLGNCYLAISEHANAVKNYKSALQHVANQDNKTAILLMQAIALYFLKDFAQALILFEQTSKNLDKLAREQLFEYYYYRGMTHLDFRNYDEAKKNLFLLPEFAKTTANYAMYYLALTIYYHLIGNLEEMNKYCEIALTYEENRKHPKDLLVKFQEEYLRSQKKIKYRFLSMLFRRK